MNTKNILLLLSAVAAGLGVLGQSYVAPTRNNAVATSAPTTSPPSLPATPREPEASIDQAFANRARDVRVAGRGAVAKVLRDDDDGSRHQRFLLRMPSGLTLLVAHNIDLAPRIDGLRTGDTVEFNGDYEWNEKGGVVHWTHRDPSGRHAAG